MILYYCCTQKDNDCPNKEKCMRYLNAKTEPHMTLFKYACKEDNGYQLFMEKEETQIVASNNKENEGIDEQDS